MPQELQRPPATAPCGSSSPPQTGHVVAISAASDGEIVVALVGEEATVKRFFREADHVRLQPENASMEPIRSKDVRILGRVVGLFRNVS